MAEMRKPLIIAARVLSGGEAVEITMNNPYGDERYYIVWEGAGRFGTYDAGTVAALAAEIAPLYPTAP